MAMSGAMATAAIFTARSRTDFSKLSSELDKTINSLHRMLITDLKLAIRHDYRCIMEQERWERLGLLRPVSTIHLENTRKMYVRNINKLIDEINRRNKTFEKRESIKKRLWYSKLSTLQKISFRLGIKAYDDTIH